MDRAGRNRGWTRFSSRGGDRISGDRLAEKFWQMLLENEAGAKGNYMGGLANSELGETNTLLSDAMSAAYNPTGSTSTTQSSLLPSILSSGLGFLTQGLGPNRSIRAETLV